MSSGKYILLLALFPLGDITPCVAFGQTSIDSIYPRAQALNVNSSTVVEVVFIESLDSLTLVPDALTINGSQSGRHLYPAISYNKQSHTVMLTPDRPFNAGEMVTVTLSSMIKTAAGHAIVPYSWSFTIETRGGTGQFAPADTVNIASGSRLLAAGDFNGDYCLDLAVSISNRDSNSVLILANDGRGRFTQKISAYPQGEPFVVEWTNGDFNQDGNRDLAALTSEGTVLLVNQGEGRLSRGQTLIDNVTPSALTTGDYDLDGDTDVAVAGGRVDPTKESHFPDTIAVWLNVGEGDYVRSSSTGVDEVSFSITSADFNEDGYVDLAASHFGGSLSVLINDGKGNFGLGRRKSRNSQIGRLKAGDFNNDGAVDLIYTDSSAGAVNLWINDHNGNFDHIINRMPEGVYWQLEVGDLDSDGDLDLITSGRPLVIYHLKNEEKGHFSISSLAELSVPASDLVLSAGDFNDDYNLDLAAIGWRWNQVFMFDHLPRPSTVIEEWVQALPDNITLHQNYPNPFNPSTYISYELSESTTAVLAIYDLLGQKVRTLVEEYKEAGYYTNIWDGSDDAGQQVGSGVYLYRLETKEAMEVKKLALIK